MVKDIIDIYCTCVSRDHSNNL